DRDGQAGVESSLRLCLPWWRISDTDAIANWWRGPGDHVNAFDRRRRAGDGAWHVADNRWHLGRRRGPSPDQPRSDRHVHRDDPDHLVTGITSRAARSA